MANDSRRGNRTRRQLLRTFAVLPFLFLDFKLARLRAALLQDSTAQMPLIDAHCHVFNVTDLAATRFAYVVLLGHYSSEVKSDPHGGLVEKLIRLAIKMLASGVPTAEEEARLLGVPLPPSAAVTATAPGPPARANMAQIDDVRRQIQREAPGADSGIAATAANKLCEARGARRATSLETILEWAGELRDSRSRLADRLARYHRDSLFAPQLLCPALVDYSCWLGETLQSPLPDQVKAMRGVALRPAGPAVHAYVPFDPLRDAMFRRRIPGPDGQWDPIALVRQALVEDGCIGVKLYPPMGFRPAGNQASGQRYPRHIVDLFGGVDELGREIDSSLDHLWAVCRELDAPIMAHAANSVDAGPNYGSRADPAFWAPVFNPAWRQRIMLGHFGRFTTMSAEEPQPQVCPQNIPFERTWEAVFARHVERNPESLVFADISYLSEVLRSRDRDRIAPHIRRYRDYDPGYRHLVFGSDWIMTGIERGFDDRPGYARRVADFLLHCGLSEEELGGVMHGNAVRFLGLGANDANRRRLVDFYVRNGRSAGRLPLA